MDEVERTPSIKAHITLAGQLDRVARASLPAAAALLMMLLAAAAPVGWPFQAALLPALTLASAWSAGSSCPDALPVPVVFAIGMSWDLLGFRPIGTGVLIVLLVYAVASRLRLGRFGAGWAVFVAVAAASALLDWALASGLQRFALPINLAVLQCALTVAVYPAVFVLLAGMRGHSSRSVQS